MEQIPKHREQKSNVKIEHLPGVDVALNLDYPNKQDQQDILDILSVGLANNKSIKELLDQIGELENDENSNRFFVKQKWGASQESVDFILGRTDVDPLSRATAKDSNRRARYAFNSVVNEITLAPEIKKLIATDEFQQLAKKYKFSALDFAEPIMAVIEKSSQEKYIFYPCVYGIEAFWMVLKGLIKEKRFRGLARELKELFLKNGIKANDLSDYRWEQFMVAPGDYLYLIDTEAYTTQNPDK